MLNPKWANDRMRVNIFMGRPMYVTQLAVEIANGERVAVAKKKCFELGGNFLWR